MMVDPAIEFRSVSKNFQRHVGRALLRSHVKELFLGSGAEEFHALKNISFSINAGEGVAVIGANGAGKSTLLSLIAGLVPADSGAVQVNGRVIPLLELGSGFHPDLSGTENVHLNAALLGVSRNRLNEIFGAIVDFAELGDFIDEPLRTYSTGMTMRLAFSVAVNLDPDILLIDEVLAVGDQAFQAKCFDKILEFRNRGKTLICVSHAAGMVQQLCTRALWLDHGDLMLDGPLPDVLEAYAGGHRTNA
jgi:ABC-type polysaccharide/polyol phosphate transport system ATPase subunit